MKDDDTMLIHIPKDREYIEILGHRIDGYDSLMSFCEHLKKYAELEETVNRQRVEIEKFADIGKMYSEIRAEAVKEFAERLKEYLDDFFHSDEDATLDTADAIDSLVKEMVGE